MATHFAWQIGSNLTADFLPQFTFAVPPLFAPHRTYAESCLAYRPRSFSAKALSRMTLPTRCSVKRHSVHMQLVLVSKGELSNSSTTATWSCMVMQCRPATFVEGVGTATWTRECQLSHNAFKRTMLIMYSSVNCDTRNCVG